MKWIIPTLGVIAVLLGGLWTLQGLGVLRIEPILCVASCEAVQGPSAAWAIVGLLVLAGGAAAIYFSLRRRLSN